MAKTMRVGESLVGEGNDVAIARAVVDSVREGVIPAGDADDLCLIVSIFIHWLAEDDQRIYDYNYAATKEAIARAMAGEPAVAAVVEQTPDARHPFAEGVEV